MTSSAPFPQRIRFRRSEIADLDALPSAQPQSGPASAGARAQRRHRLKRRLGAAGAVCFLLFFVLVAVLYAAGASGFGQEKLRLAAERAIERLLGRDLTTAVGGTRLSFDGTRLIGLEVSDIGLTAVGEPGQLARASSLRFGIDLLPLLSGRVVLGTASLSDAKIAAAAFGFSDERDVLRNLREGQGLLDPDRVPPVLFAALKRLLTALAQGGSGAIELSNIVVALPGTNASHTVTIVSAEAKAAGPLAFSLSADGLLDGRRWTAKGSAEREAVSGRIEAFSLAIDVPANGEAGRRPATSPLVIGALGLRLSGSEGSAETPSRLGLSARLGESLVDLGLSGIAAGSIDLAASLVEGSNKIEIEKLLISSGKSAFDLNGAVGPRPTVPGQAPAYRYELIGDDLVSSAEDSPEPPLRFKARIAGAYDPAARRLEAAEWGASGGLGSVKGRAAVRFEPGLSPGMDLELAIADMPLSHVKQLWPWFAARAARRWAQQHLSGGTLSAGRLSYAAAPGRIGDGVPAGSHEVSARFLLDGTRFDTAGRLPAVEDAAVSIAVLGTDVDIVLSQGTMRLPSGRLFAARNATLALRATTMRPVIGRLEADVQGDAAAAAEIASLEPIGAEARLPFRPEGLSGTVSGHVSADIPLEPGVPRGKLAWKVALDFDGLGIAEGIQGQRVTDATGSLTIDPLSAVVAASAKLNGAPARLDLVEPLTQAGPERRRKIALTLDDTARNAIAPGLATILSGPVSVEIDARSPAPTVKADLSRARLDLPWIGWYKGAGVAASAEFTVSRSDGAAAITDLSIAGQSFSLAGDLSLAEGGLRSAHFGSVRLNRNDQASVDIRRDGTGYDVKIKGDAFDGRALLKAATAAGHPSAKGSVASAGGSISLDARLGTVSGFSGEALKDVSVSLRASGPRSRALSIDALTDTGTPVSMQDVTKSGGRRITLASEDAGSMLRFFNIYSNMEGGTIAVSLAGPTDGALTGTVSARNFTLVNEPRLISLVAAKAPGSDRSLGDAVRKTIDTSRVSFDRASAEIVKGGGSLQIASGVLRGSTIGSTFQGTLYDAQGRMDMTGTFMPAYGLNRLFGELPLIGIILGNGNDRGLLGVTFKLQGNAKSPTVTVNPLSLIAPGIFRQIFEYSN